MQVAIEEIRIEHYFCRLEQILKYRCCISFLGNFNKRQALSVISVQWFLFCYPLPHLLLIGVVCRHGRSRLLTEIIPLSICIFFSFLYQIVIHKQKEDVDVRWINANKGQLKCADARTAPNSLPAMSTSLNVPPSLISHSNFGFKWTSLPIQWTHNDHIVLAALNYSVIFAYKWLPLQERLLVGQPIYESVSVNLIRKYSTLGFGLDDELTVECKIHSNIVFEPTLTVHPHRRSGHLAGFEIWPLTSEGQTSRIEVYRRK